MQTIKKDESLYPNNLKRYREAKQFESLHVSKLLRLPNNTLLTAWEEGRLLPDLASFLVLCMLYDATADDLYRQFMSDLAEMIRRQTEDFVLPTIGF